MQPETADFERVRRTLGATPIAWRAASGHGAPSHRRFVVALPSGRSAFVKIAAFDYTAGWLREEFRLYAGLDGQPFLPRMLGWDDDGLAPALALEDLSEATWPPPWDVARIDAVLATLASVHATPPPEDVPPAVESQFGMDGWPDVAADPEPSFPLASVRESGSSTTLPLSRMRRPPPRSREPPSCTSTCAATTCVCGRAGPCWSTGTTRASGTPCWTSPPGFPASKPKAVRRRA